MEQGADGQEIKLSLAGAGASFGAVLDSGCGDDNEAGCLVSGQASCFLGSVVGQVCASEVSHVVFCHILFN